MDDWQVGDLALCVDASDIGGLGRFGPKMLSRGACYRVIGVTPPSVWAGDDIDIGLILDGPLNRTRDGDWHHGRFRKIRPLSDEERDSFLADLDAPLFTPEPSEVALAGSDTTRPGHIAKLKSAHFHEALDV